MNKPKWRFKIKNGKIEVEGMEFKGDQCVHDVIYHVLQQNTTIENEQRKEVSEDDNPVINTHYVGN